MAISTLFSEDFLSTWVNPLLLDAEIGAAFLLGIGIIFESDRFCEEVKKTAFWMVMVGVVLETVFSIALFKSEDWITDSQRSTIRAQNSEIIALRRNALPRTIDVSAFSERLKSAPPARVEIRYVVACNDCESLSFWLSETLKTANWSVDPVIPIAPQDWVRAARSLHAQSTGITVVIDSPDKITADPKTSLGALNRALEQELGFSFLGYDTAIQGGVDVTMPPNVIRLVVAPKA